LTIDTDFSPPRLSEPLRVENLRKATLAGGFKATLSIVTQPSAFVAAVELAA
jgi:hypothetical protein